MGIWPNFTGMIEPWVVPYQNCSNRSSWLHKLVMGSINRFLKWNFKKSSCLKLQGPDLYYLVYSIIYRSFTTVVQIMPLGFSIIGSTMTFDLFLRWATQGPLGPLVLLASIWHRQQDSVFNSWTVTLSWQKRENYKTNSFSS